MMAKRYDIEFKNITQFLHFGYFEEERKLGQRISIDLCIKLDASKYSQFSELHDIYDYSAISSILKSVFNEKEYLFLEELSEVIAQKLLNTDDNIQTVMITIRKPSVPIDLSLDHVLTTMEFSR